MKYPKSYYQISRFKALDLQQRRCLILEFSTLSSLNGFRNVSEIKVIEFQKPTDPKASAKITFERQSHQTKHRASLEQLISNTEAIDFLGCTLTSQRLLGSIPSRQGIMKWEMKNFEAAEAVTQSEIKRKDFSFIQRGLKSFPKTLFIKNYAEPVKGWIQKEGSSQDSWDQSLGSLSLFAGTRLMPSWNYLSCSHFQDPQGDSVDLKVEGLQMQNKLFGWLPLPHTCFYTIQYKGKRYHFKRVSKQSRVTNDDANVLELQAGSLVFKLQHSSNVSDFFCMTREDTEGRLQYHSIAPMVDLDVLIYENGKLSAHFLAKSSAHIEQVTQNKPSAISIVN